MFARPSSEKQRAPLLVQAADAAGQTLNEAVRAWLAETGAAADEEPALSAGFWALAHGFVMLSAKGHLPRNVHTQCEPLLDRLMGTQSGRHAPSGRSSCPGTSGGNSSRTTCARHTCPLSGILLWSANDRNGGAKRKDCCNGRRQRKLCCLLFDAAGGPAIGAASSWTMPLVRLIDPGLMVGWR